MSFWRSDEARKTAKKSRKATTRKTAKSQAPISRKPSRVTPKAGPMPDPLDALIETTGLALGIRIDPMWLPAIRADLQVTSRLGATVTA